MKDGDIKMAVPTASKESSEEVGWWKKNVHECVEIETAALAGTHHAPAM